MNIDFLEAPLMNIVKNISSSVQRFAIKQENRLFSGANSKKSQTLGGYSKG